MINMLRNFVNVNYWHQFEIILKKKIKTRISLYFFIIHLFFYVNKCEKLVLFKYRCVEASVIFDVTQLHEKLSITTRVSSYRYNLNKFRYLCITSHFSSASVHAMHDAHDVCY